MSHLYRSLVVLASALGLVRLPAQVPSDVIPLTATVVTSPTPSITLHWPSSSTAQYHRVYWRAVGTEGWNFAVQLSGTATSFTDNNFGIGETWEYMVTRTLPYPRRWTTCVPVGSSLTIRFNDPAGDGLCCAFGAGAWYVEACGSELARGGRFETSEQATFTVCGTSGCSDVSVVVEPDQFVDPVTWELRNASNELVLSGGPMSAPVYGIIQVGIEVPAEEFPGDVLLIIADHLSTPLDAELDQLVSDLVAEGRRVHRESLPTSATVAQVRALVQSTRASWPSLSTVLLIGHVPVPYSGRIAPDGHLLDHYGAWPADGYYGELDGPWTDESVNVSNLSMPVRNYNVPGDGKFDQSHWPSPVDLMVGRIDLSDLPAFPMSEVDLTKAYLQRTHAFRTGAVTYQPQVVVDDHFPFYEDESMIHRSCTPMFGPNAIAAGEIMQTGSGVLWGHGSGPGSFVGAEGVSTTYDMVQSGPRTAFLSLFGSYFGDWDTPDNFLRAALAAGALGVVWGTPELTFHEMALNAPIGRSVRRSQNATYGNNGRISRSIQVALMGDPTLTNYPLAPVQDLSLDQLEEGLQLSWTGVPEAHLGYRIYRRAQAGLPFIFQGSTTTTTYLDVAPLGAASEYLVRSWDQDTSASGTFRRLGPGVIVPATFTVGNDTRALADRFRVYPSPNTGQFTLTGPVHAPHRAELIDLRGRSVPLRTTGVPGALQISTDAAPGLYFLRIQISEGLTTIPVVITE